MTELKSPSHFSVKLAQVGAQSSDDVFVECQLNALEFAAAIVAQRGWQSYQDLLAEIEKLKHPPLKRR